MLKIARIVFYPPRKDNFVATVSVTLRDGGGSSIVVNDLRLIRNRQGHLWLGAPSYSTKTDVGWSYAHTVEFSKELYERIEHEVRDEWIAKHPQDAEVRQ